MNTVSEREKAKGTITRRSDDDPELDLTLSEANRLKIEMTMEQNRSKEVLRRMEIGWFGRAFGGEKVSPTYFAAITALLGVIGAGTCWGLASGAADPSVRCQII